MQKRLNIKEDRRKIKQAGEKERINCAETGNNDRL